jgi:hypothetical protein
MLRFAILILSLLALTAVITLSALSSAHSLVIGINTRTGDYLGVTICENRLVVAWCTLHGASTNHNSLLAATWTDSDVVAAYLSIYDPDPKASWKRKSFKHTTFQTNWQTPVSGTIITFSTWWLTTLLSLPLVSRIYRHRRANRWHREGRCRKCGYDLRGLTSDRCPECGEPVHREVRTPTGTLLT